MPGDRGSLRGAGAALLKDLQRLQKIVVAVKSITDIPVTAKIRTGWDADSIVVEDAAQAAEAAGADAVTVHAGPAARDTREKPAGTISPG